MAISKTKRSFFWLLLLIIASVIIIRNNQPKPETYQTSNGIVFGTIYKIIYLHDAPLSEEIKAELKRFDFSLSMFNQESIISKINTNQPTKLDSLCLKVFTRSLEISAQTNGAFDITVAPLVNAWGFGFKKQYQLSQEKIDSLKQFIGYDKIHIEGDSVLIKDDPKIMLDCSAIAKGYACDVIGDLLLSHGVKNFMIDIGGELTLKGHGPSSKDWRIGINKPVDDSLSINNEELSMIVAISNVGIATSGNYRNFYYKEGKKYAHTIDPRTGYPIQHSLLSSTVIAKDCLTADATATAFMVMGLEDSKRYLENHPDVKACLIYTDENGLLKQFISPLIKSKVSEVKNN
ncbi:MAG: FAD:protein FMN transferase [Bacteroidaceae bacterium]